MIQLLGRTLAILLLLIGHAVVAAEQLAGHVVGIADGDTLTVLVNRHDQYKIRLAGIDAPEKKQPFGQKAKNQLSDLAFQKNVVVDFAKQDRYGRIVGKVLVDGRDVNVQMIESGLAWHYKQYAREQSAQDRSVYAAAEERARQARVGLWQDSNPTPPWAFRHGNR